ncbi:MAG: hypothetical protein N0A16_06675 [Blastocatellia bacterium]|nr:hypothetical protein [Blastocatellia bacterium]MCS7157393.1 hypothetical protein [Blastocatellia bacterium]MCX7752567.1 hypothetical protein [Blastocatellia bacterium]MDW8168298.1 hypothetical protein [Acidobacteriota bacterium]MDW8255494.1 hypothetical protein [Acidobacteriota bacterium]
MTRTGTWDKVIAHMKGGSPMRSLGIVFLLAWASFLGLQFASPDFADPDAYYHIVLAEFPAHRLDTRFPWLSATTWRDEFADLHWLYHLLLWPFVKVDRIAGAKVATALFSAIAATTLFGVLRYLQVPLPAFWTFAAFAFSASGLLRYNLMKVNALALTLLLLALWAMWEKRWKVLLLAAALFTLSYGAAVLLLLVVIGAFTVVRYLEVRQWPFRWERDEAESGFPWQPITYTLAGIALGLLLHPHFPTALILFIRAFQVTQRPSSTIFGPLHEWHGLSPIWLLLGSLLLAVPWLIGIGLWLRRRRWRGQEAFLVLISVLLCAMTLRHGRFIEYWAPLAALSAAVTLREETLRWYRKIVANWQQWMGLLILASIPVMINLGATILWLRAGNQSIQTFKGAMLWLAEHSQPGAIVFHARWDQFAHLFFWNQRNHYIVGLDVAYLYHYDRGLYWTYRHIQSEHEGTCRMEHCPPMSLEEQDRSVVEAIVRDFRAAYVLVVKRETPRLLATLQRRQDVFERVYDDPQVSVYKVRQHP